MNIDNYNFEFTEYKNKISYIAFGILFGASAYFVWRIFTKKKTIKYTESINKNLESKNENKKIDIINSSPLELTDRFEKKGFVVIKDGLASTNKTIDEFIELMRCYKDLKELNGCKNPESCTCKFRHKYCRLFMMRLHSDFKNKPKYYSPTCDGYADMTVTKNDISEMTNKYKFINLYEKNFYDKVLNLIGYVDFIIDPTHNNKYVVDVLFIADPYYEGQEHRMTNGYGTNLIEQNQKKDENTKLNKFKRICNCDWHIDEYVDNKTKQKCPYDCVALFILNNYETTSHELLIGKIPSDNTIKNIQDIKICKKINISHNTKDIGYIINQNMDLYHQHTEFEHLSLNSRRNVIAIRYKYQDNDESSILDDQ